MQVDYLIIGQGLAGTCVALEAEKRGKSYIIVSDNNIPKSSNVAGGIINPVTGKQLTKTWRIDETLNFTKKTYQSYEKLLKCKFFKEKNAVSYTHLTLPTKA